MVRISAESGKRRTVYIVNCVNTACLTDPRTSSCLPSPPLDAVLALDGGSSMSHVEFKKWQCPPVSIYAISMAILK